METEFYRKHCSDGNIPAGVHHELELLAPPVWEHAHQTLIHVHRVPVAGTVFVCWIGSLPTLATAKKLFEMWSIGTTYTMTSGKDFSGLYQGEPEQFLKRMAEEYCLNIDNSTVENFRTENNADALMVDGHRFHTTYKPKDREMAEERARELGGIIQEFGIRFLHLQEGRPVHWYSTPGSSVWV